MRSTPETDAEIRTYSASDPRDDWQYVDSKFARRLERQRDILFDALVGLMNAPADGGINTSDAISDALAALNTVEALRA